MMKKDLCEAVNDKGDGRVARVTLNASHAAPGSQQDSKQNQNPDNKTVLIQTDDEISDAHTCSGLLARLEGVREARDSQQALCG